MGSFAVGDVVLVAFPYADFSRFKKRPALVIGTAEFDNLILCQITSKAETSMSAIMVTNDDFLSGELDLISFARPDKIFTVSKSVIERGVGKFSENKTGEIKSRVRKLFQ